MTRTKVLYTGTPVDLDALEEEWVARWKDLRLEDLPYLFGQVKVTDTYPATLHVYIRCSSGDEVADPSSPEPIWSEVPEGAITVSAPPIAGLWTSFRIFVGREVSGVVVQSDKAGVVTLSRSSGGG